MKSQSEHRTLDELPRVELKPSRCARFLGSQGWVIIPVRENVFRHRSRHLPRLVQVNNIFTLRRIVGKPERTCILEQVLQDGRP